MLAPRSAKRAFMAGSAMAALVAALSLATMSAGVALGAPIPNQVLASYPGTNSASEGVSGSNSERWAVVTASARSLRLERIQWMTAWGRTTHAPGRRANP